MRGAAEAAALGDRREAAAAGLKRGKIAR